MIANAVGIVGRRDHDHTAVGLTIRESPWVGDHPERLSDEVHVGSDVWIGYGATILSGVRIGSSSIIGAGALVITDIPPNAVAVGVPARVVSERFSTTDLQRHWSRLTTRGVRVDEAHN